jgi:Rrf2 family nitric oxide-sensitive transcriptional repressor
MRLTQWTDYSLRVLLFCASHEGRDTPVTITEIQQAHGISRHHLTKVVMSLAALGYVATTRGRGGGLRLLASAATTTVGDIVRHTETDFRLVECFDAASNTCVLDGHCRLKFVLQDAKARFLEVLDGVTLAELLTPGMKRAAALPMTFRDRPASTQTATRQAARRTASTRPARPR